MALKRNTELEEDGREMVSLRTWMWLERPTATSVVFFCTMWVQKNYTTRPLLREDIHDLHRETKKKQISWNLNWRDEDSEQYRARRRDSEEETRLNVHNFTCTGCEYVQSSKKKKKKKEKGVWLDGMVPTGTNFRFEKQKKIKQKKLFRLWPHSTAHSSFKMRMRSKLQNGWMSWTRAKPVVVKECGLSALLLVTVSSSLLKGWSFLLVGWNNVEQRRPWRGTTWAWFARLRRRYWCRARSPCTNGTEEGCEGNVCQHPQFRIQGLSSEAGASSRNCWLRFWTSFSR